MDSLKEKICDAWKMFSLWKYRQFVLFMIAVGIAFILAYISETAEPLECEELCVAWVWGVLLIIGALLLGKNVLGIGLFIFSLAYSVYYSWQCCLNMICDWEFAYKVLFFILTILLVRVIASGISTLYCSSPQNDIEYEPDGLSRTRAYDRVHARIRLQKEGTGHAYALMGEWGSGKTHLLKYLYRRLRKPYIKEHYDDVSDENQSLYKGAYSIHWVTLWHYHTIETANAAIIKALYALVVGQQLPFSSKQFYGLTRLLLNLYTQDADKIVSALESVVFSFDNNIDDAIGTINEHLNARNERALLFIEDVERAELSVIENLLPMIERLRKIQNLTIVCALDFDELQKKCQLSKIITSSIQGYIDKIFDMSFSMPEMPQSISKRFFAQCVRENYPECKELLAFAEICNVDFSGPRQIRRVITRLASIEWMYFLKGENCESINYVPIATVFYVEIMRSLYATEYNELREAKDREEIINELTLLTKDSAIKQNDFSKRAPESYKRYNTDGTFRSILNTISYSSNDYGVSLNYSFNQEYKRRIYLTEEECVQIILSSLNNEGADCHKLIHEFFGNALPEDIDGAKESLLYQAYRLAYVDSTSYKDLGKNFLITQLCKEDRRYDWKRTFGYYFSKGFSNPFSYACMECTLVQELNDNDDVSRSELLSILEDKLPYVDLVVLLGRLLYIQEPGFDVNETSENMAAMYNKKSSKQYKDAVNGLTKLCGERIVDFVLHSSWDGIAAQSIQDGTFNIYDDLKNNSLRQKFLSSAENTFSALSCRDKYVLLGNLFRLLESQTLFPPVCTLHAISIAGITLWEKILDDVELSVILEKQQEAQKTEMQDKLRELITKYESCISTLRNKMPNFKPERNYIEGNKRLVSKLKRLSKLLNVA